MRRTLPLRPVLLLTSIGIALATSACGSSDTVTTVVERVTTVQSAPVGEPDSASDGAEVQEASAAPAQEQKSTKKRASKKRSCRRVPDIVGRENLQVSQDILQEAGFYSMRQRDATGRGRSQLWDRNWVVVRQSPKPGACVSLSTTIVTWSKKHGE